MSTVHRIIGASDSGAPLCRNCRKWGASFPGACDGRTQAVLANPPSDGFIVRYWGDDPSADIEMLTGANFGCVKFEAK